MIDVIDAPFIRSAGLSDLSAIRQQQRVCFGADAYYWWTLLGLLLTPGTVSLKALQNNKLVGFIAAEANPFDGCGWIVTVGVLPEFQGYGFGAALLQAAERQLNPARMRLTVRVGNQRALRLYERLGYRQCGTRPRYYADGEDGWVMEKSCAAETRA